MDKQHPRVKDVRGIFASAAFILLGIVVIYVSRGYGPLGSVFPLAIGTAMIVAAAGYIVMAALGYGTLIEPLDGSNVRRVAIFVVLLVWAMLLEVLGFLTSSLLGFFAVLLVANFDRWTVRTAITYVFVGAFVVTCLFLLFGEVLKVSFPAGMLI
jgi:hypothetical protein